jgi:predicted lipid-binding transport protein (Tim44 family)
MKSLIALSTALVLGLSLTLTTGDAEAKRLGGGRSSGMQREAVSPQKAPTAAPATAPSAAPTQNAAAPAAGAAQPKRSWMGPLAGLAAGLGLAALASHFGFGQELASMLMIGLAVMAVLMLIGFIMRKRAAAQQPHLASADGMQYAPAGATPQAEPMMKQAAFKTPAIGSGLAGTGAPAAVSVEAVERKGNIPADFDVAGFVRNAKVNFIRLQAANDAANLDDIRDFTSPEMFAEIKLDIDERGKVEQQTEVIKLDAEVIEVAEEAARYVVSVRFTGEVREEKGAAPVALDEVWHLSKPRDGNKGWVVAGIQQVQ